jgi:hypothetical protein
MSTKEVDVMNKCKYCEKEINNDLDFCSKDCLKTWFCHTEKQLIATCEHCGCRIYHGNFYVTDTDDGVYCDDECFFNFYKEIGWHCGNE